MQSNRGHSPIARRRVELNEADHGVGVVSSEANLRRFGRVPSRSRLVGLDPTEAVALVHGDGRVDLLVRSDLTATGSPEIEAYLADHPPVEPAQ